jgi:hypothetical protein
MQQLPWMSVVAVEAKCFETTLFEGAGARSVATANSNTGVMARSWIPA